MLQKNAKNPTERSTSEFGGISGTFEKDEVLLDRTHQAEEPILSMTLEDSSRSRLLEETEEGCHWAVGRGA